MKPIVHLKGDKPGQTKMAFQPVFAKIVHLKPLEIKQADDLIIKKLGADLVPDFLMQALIFIV